MAADGEAGAAAAAEYFMRLYDYVLATGDFEEWELVSWEQCEFCSGISRDFGAIYGSGGRFEPGEFSVSVADLPQRDPQVGGFLVLVDMRHGIGIQYDAGGAEVARTSDETVRAQVDVAFLAGGWTFMALSLAG